MSTRTLAAAALGLAGALIAAPMSALHAQVTSSRDSAAKPPWNVNPGAQTTSTQAAATTDSAFIREVLTGNVVEVRLGKLAQDKASDSSVKQFGEQMVTAHTAMNKEWGAVAPKTKVGFEQVFSEAQQQELKQLEQLSGAEFDRAYMTAMIQDHQRTAAAFQTQGASAQSPEVRQLVSSELPTIQQHLSMAQQIGSKVGVSPSVATVPPTPNPTTFPTRRDTTAFPNRADTATREARNREEQVAGRRAGGGEGNLKEDRELVQNMVAASLMEVRLSELAKQKANNSDVKRFAKQIGNDFSDWQNRWTELAARENKSWQPSMGHLHKDKVERVQKAGKGQFDRVYMATVIQHLEALLPYFQKEGRNAESARVRNLFESELPTLRENLATARRIGDKVNVDSKSLSERK